jgi:hypothetical protein
MSKKIGKITNPTRRMASKNWRKREVAVIEGREPHSGNVKMGWLDRDRRYLSPARVVKKFAEVKKLLTTQTIWGKPVVREWQRGDLHRLYWPDGSYIYVDGTGFVRSSGGMATQAKFSHRLT